MYCIGRKGEFFQIQTTQQTRILDFDRRVGDTQALIKEIDIEHKGEIAFCTPLYPRGLLLVSFYPRKRVGTTPWKGCLLQLAAVYKSIVLELESKGGILGDGVEKNKSM